MNDKKLEMLKEIERIKKNEMKKFNSSRNLLELEKDLHELNYGKSLLQERLNSLPKKNSLTKSDNEYFILQENLSILTNEINRLSNQIENINKIRYEDNIKKKERESDEIYSSVKDKSKSKHAKNLAIEEKYYLEISRKFLLGEITIGEGIQQLRKNFLRLNQEKFAKLVGVSRKTISDVENNRGNLSIETLNAIAKPFQLKLTLLPTSSDILEKLIDKH
ncbi:TPA: helix-turn-helix transcriptional regulator [Providencia alcalifaciens]